MPLSLLNQNLLRGGGCFRIKQYIYSKIIGKNDCNIGVQLYVRLQLIHIYLYTVPVRNWHIIQIDPRYETGSSKQEPRSQIKLNSVKKKRKFNFAGWKLVIFLGTLNDFNTVLQLCGQSINKKIQKIQMDTHPNLARA